MSDYSFLKTGSNNLIEPNKPNDELIVTVGAMVSSFVENALKSSEVYVKHSNRNSITKTDLKLALMNETFHYLNDKDTPENIQRWREIINGFDSDDEDIIEGVDLGDDEPEDEPEDEFVYSKCKCVLCQKNNSVEEYWKEWVPNEGIETILKRTIDEKF